MVHTTRRSAKGAAPKTSRGSRFPAPPFPLFLLHAASRVLQVVCLVLPAILFTGCLFLPKLAVSPTALSFRSASERESFAISSEEAGILTWALKEVAWNTSTEQWGESDIPWLTVDGGKMDGITFLGTDRVFLVASREGLAAGTYVGAGIQVQSNGGTITIPVSLTVSTTTEPGTPGEVKLDVKPTAVTINGLSDTGTFDLTNEGEQLVHWYLTIRIDASSVPADAEIQIAASPTEAVTEPTETTTVTVGVPDPSTFDTGTLNYIIAICNEADNTVIQEVRVTVDLVGPPVIALDPNVLDFGREGYQITFRVANVGDASSILDFAVFNLIEDAADVYVPFDVEEDALIATLDAPQGMTDVHADPTDPDDWVNAREVSVTIDRDGIEEDLEFRELWIGSVGGTDTSGNPVMDPDVTPQKLLVRVEAAPYIEGAINRSRPPSLMRFVFLLRDKRGLAINADDERIRDQITFFTKEDGFPLDPDESSQFITGPENLKYNLVLLLDFTGSMYRAGTRDPRNPLTPGEAIRQMKEAAKQFILDLPETYRVALMEYHDRDQPSRIIHGFDTNKETLLAALDVFSLPAAEHGASALYDALYDASQTLTQEDSAVALPFDEADVRAVVFVSDGWDTSSDRKINELTKFAQDNRARFYPIGFSGRISNPVNASVLIQLANETGGHTYYAPEIGGLAKLLDTEKALVFDSVATDLSNKTTTVRLRNTGTDTLTWRLIENLDWLTVFPPSGNIPPLHRDTDGIIDEPGIREITVTPIRGLSSGTYQGAVRLTSDNGDATWEVAATVADAGALSAFSVIPHTDDAGKVWRELRGQVVLSYTSLFQSGTHTYLIQATYPDTQGELTSAAFEKDAVFYSGDTRAGQISLSTTGIHDGKAEVFVRADYVPRNITQLRVRFTVDVPAALAPNLSLPQRTALLNRLKTALNNGGVKVTPQGLLDGWRLISTEGNGIFTLVTEPDQFLPYGAFGDLLKLSFEGLGGEEAFALSFRVDNSVYYSPATSTSPSLTKYFLYPGGHLNPEGILSVARQSSTASPALSVSDFAQPFDPESSGAWDRDGDAWADFDDSAPDDPNIGDNDKDGVPDLDDPAPFDPNIP